MEDRHFRKIHAILDRAENGEVVYIPMTKLGGFSQHVDLAPDTQYLVGGDSGTGKTAFVHEHFVLNPYKWWLKYGSEYNIDLEIYIRSMERPPEYTILKWGCNLAYQQDNKVVLDVKDVIGRGRKTTAAERDLHRRALNFIKDSRDVIHIIGGATNPTDIWHHMIEIAKKNGEVVTDNFGRVKEYNIENRRKIVIYIIDHMGKARTESTIKGSGIALTDKGVMDRLSSYSSEARDIFGFTQVLVQQFNRGIADLSRRSHGDLTVERTDFKGSANTFEDSDVVMGLLNPYVYNVPSWKGTMGYSIPKMTGRNKINRFRGLSLLKNSYGADNLHTGCWFLGETGIFKPMPKAAEHMTERDYELLANPYG